MRLPIGISPCPNDTFAFHALLERKIRVPGVELEFRLADVQALNEMLARGELAVGKASFHAALGLTDRYGVLPAGSALGFGNGPLLLRSAKSRSNGSVRVLSPGAMTTACLLFRLFGAELCGRDLVLEHVSFDQILPALERGEADYGICIHEGRFTYREHGLELVADLGRCWEDATKSPLPLGGILAQHSLGADLHRALGQAIRDSIDYAYSHRPEVRTTMRKHAQELDDHVIDQHVELYVNERTRDLGSIGEHALRELETRARAVGMMARDARSLAILGGST